MTGGQGGWGRWDPHHPEVRINRPGMPDHGAEGTITYCGRTIEVTFADGKVRYYDTVDLIRPAAIR